MEQSFIAYIENSIKENWDLDALTDYKGATLQYKDVARKIETVSYTHLPANSERTDQLQPADAFNSSQGYILIAVATLMAVMAWIWAFWLLSKSSEHNAY